MASNSKKSSKTSSKKNNKTSSKKLTATQQYKNKIKSYSSMVPDYEEQYFEGGYVPETFVSQYTPTVFEDNYEPVEYTDSYTPEQYESKYMPEIEQRMNALNNWSYDPLQDASYQALAKVYGARGNIAAKNTLADAAALNGGFGSSYAVSAAQQARNQYNQELAALIPDLEQASYERQQAGLNNLMALDESQYGRFSDDQSRQLQSKQFGLDVAGYNEGNRQFKANYGLDVAGFNEGNKQFQANYDLDVFKTNEANRQFAAQFGLDAYGANQQERQFGYGAGLDKLSMQQDLLEGGLAFKDRQDAKKDKAKAKTKTGGTKSGSKVSYGSGVSSYASTPVIDTFTKGVQAVEKKKKPTTKGTASGGGLLHNKQQYR